MDAKQVLIIQTAFIGDALLTVPLLKRVRALYPDSKLTLLCRKGVGNIFVRLKLVDSIVEFDKSKTSDWGTIQSQLSQSSFDLILSPHQSFRSEMLVRKLQSKIKIGYKKWWNFFIFDQTVDRPMQYPESLRLMSLLSPIDDEVRSFFESLQEGNQFLNSDSQTTVNFTREVKIPELVSPLIKNLKLDAEETVIDKLVKDFNIQTYRLILFAPGSVWATKKWTMSGFSELAKKLQESGYQIAVIGSNAERGDCDALAKAVPNAVNLCGETSLSESLELMRRSALLVSNDSGAAHIASLVGLKTISIFGPTVLGLGYRPWNNNVIVNQVELKCRPCGLHGSDKCPIGTHECMKNVNATNVLINAEKLLSR